MHTDKQTYRQYIQTYIQENIQIYKQHNTYIQHTDNDRQTYNKPDSHTEPNTNTNIHKYIQRIRQKHIQHNTEIRTYIT